MDFRRFAASILAVLSMGSGPRQVEEPARLAGSPPDDRPRAVYHSDPTHPWNRTFNALFTRTVRVRLAGELVGDRPAERVRHKGFADLPVSRDGFERIELGDRDFAPLDPFPIHIGGLGSPLAILADPRFGRLRDALDEAVGVPPERLPSATARVLMQSDLWAAHDLLVAARPRDEVGRARKEELLDRLVPMIGKLALTAREIEALPDNFAEAALPFDLFGEGGPWIEVEYFPTRFHDRSADDRKAGRIFLKPSRPPDDRAAWLDGLRPDDGHQIEKFEAVALVVQLLAVDAGGTVVPTKLTSEVQVRTFPKGEDGRALPAGLFVAELGRAAMLLDRRGGGLRTIEDREPAYLPRSGNDYFLPMPRPSDPEPLLAPLRMRCQACHGTNLARIATFSFHDPAPPPVRALAKAGNEHGRSVARRKMLRPDFQELGRRRDR